MPRIEEEVIIKASAEEIYKFLVDSSKLAKLLPWLEVKVREKDEDHQITGCKLTTEKGDIFSWQQRENFDSEMLRVDYALIEGDWQNFVGRWQVNEAGEESELILQVEAQPKEQGLKAFLAWPFLWIKMRRFCQEAIQAVKDRLEL